MGSSLPIFRGETDALQFVQNFSTYADFHGWSDDQARKDFAFALHSKAALWYISLDEEQIRSVKDLIELFRESFVSETDNFVLRQQLTNRKQLAHKRVAQYASDVRHRCLRLNLQPGEILHFFIQGL